MLIKSTSKKNDLQYSEKFVKHRFVAANIKSPKRSKSEVQSPLRNVMLMIKLIRFRYSCRTIWLLIPAMFLYGISGALGFVPIMPELIKTLR